MSNFPYEQRTKENVEFPGDPMVPSSLIACGVYCRQIVLSEVANERQQLFGQDCVTSVSASPCWVPCHPSSDTIFWISSTVSYPKNKLSSLQRLIVPKKPAFILVIIFNPDCVFVLFKMLLHFYTWIYRFNRMHIVDTTSIKNKSAWQPNRQHLDAGNVFEESNCLNFTLVWDELRAKPHGELVAVLKKRRSSLLSVFTAGMANKSTLHLFCMYFLFNFIN